jgi:hypothetical protein
MTITAREVERQRKQARREREADLKKKDREALRRLRGHLKHARKYRKDRMRAIVRLCRDVRAANRERAKAIRAEHRRQAAAEILRRRDEARGACEGAKEQLTQKVQGSIARAAAALHAEREHQHGMRVWAERDPLKRAGDRRGAASRARAEARAESDSEVEANLPAELLPVWRAVKHKIKEGPRRTRTEAFTEWAHDHPSDVERIAYDTIDRDVARLVAAEAELRKRDAGHWRRQSDEEIDRAHASYDMPAEAVPF